MAKKIQLTKNGEDVYPITVPDSIAGLAQVAKTGSYNDLSDTPLPSPPEVFLITRDVTTYAEIYAAVNAGKVCMMYYGDDVYTVTCCENGEPIHLYTYGNNGISGVEISPEDEWEWVDYYYTDFVIFHAKIGRSTLYQIFYAVNARMLVLGLATEDAMGDELYSLVAISYGNQGYALFSRTDEDGTVYFAKVTKSGNQESWSYSERFIASSLSELSDDSTHRLVTDAEKATWNGKYTKPVSGIPASDIASGVIPSYGMANANTLGLVRVDKNAGGINKDSGGKLILDAASDAEIAAKTTLCALKVRQIDQAVKVGVTTNANTLSASEKAAAQAWLGVYDAIHPAVQTSQPAGGFAPNVLYNLGTLAGNTTFALASPADANIVNHYYWTFDTPATAPTITWPTGLTWMGGSAPTINASKHYEISVLGGIGVAMEV